MPSDKTKNVRFPFGIVSVVLLLIGAGLWLYTGLKIFLFAAVPAAIFTLVATLAGILLLLEQFRLHGKRKVQ